MALLLLRHAMNLSNNNSDDQEDDPSAFFIVKQHYLLPTVLCIVSCHNAYAFVSSAFHATCCGFSPPMLHHGLGHQYITTP